MDTGVKHSGREVYHSSPPSVEIMNEWSCISASLLCHHTVDRDFFLIFHMRATCRAHHVMRLLCSLKLPSFKFLPAATSRVHTFSRHTTLLFCPLLLLARPTMLDLFIVITIEKGTFKFNTWQVSLSCNLLSRIPNLVVHTHATKECRRSGGITPHILKVGTR